ncbi:hypothetical protein CC1G_08934 [Coprinopsis cinerea okayama7|uniref:Uncharacterized protein n=1 Tax=Coprinopsis cinerea (strain Okayama-7 / 130 / ATCC MYA-4618 / FGSC 9003) TaxID=240176 RepID=A8P4M5_COPC7|nr:hypothetical protein CC1G_08934 [Coprinopsis cinerea okayama7\|eukprot:XP_001838770.2 hypothetical protein CC1G_08934 [Coprinopsis cinerea okayama7\
MAIGDRLAIIRQYTKTTSKEQFDRLIPHGLPAFESDLLIQVHVLARPFAQFLASYIWPKTLSAVAAYRDMLFMGYGKEICPDAASRKMGQLSLTMFGWSMTISDWRHINIGWKCHLILCSKKHGHVNGVPVVPIVPIVPGVPVRLYGTAESAESKGPWPNNILPVTWPCYKPAVVARTALFPNDISNRMTPVVATNALSNVDPSLIVGSSSLIVSPSSLILTPSSHHRQSIVTHRQSIVVHRRTGRSIVAHHQSIVRPPSLLVSPSSPIVAPSLPSSVHRRSIVADRQSLSAIVAQTALILNDISNGISLKCISPLSLSSVHRRTLILCSEKHGHVYGRRRPSSAVGK